LAGSTVVTVEEVDTSAMVAEATRAWTKKLRARRCSGVGSKAVIENPFDTHGGDPER
jgi:hypothetical protein